MTTQRKRIMKDFRITELGAVDRPAQGLARAVLLKRADDEQEQEQDMTTFAKVDDGDAPQSFDSLEEAMQAIRKREGCTPLAAMERASRAHPELVEKMRQDGREAMAKAITRIATTPAEVVRFDDAVRQVMQRDGVSKLVAMQTVVREQPRLYEAYQAAAATPSDLGLRPAGAFAT